ncbi:MAG TPA: hypothetical protein VG518_04140 [Solirubrobacterales bacterium]|nr:hypothetical protein [Solirubrobacterales bacterium]
MNEERLRWELHETPIAGEAAAGARALRLSRAAFEGSSPAAREPRLRRSWSLRAALVLGLVAAAISPAGAVVRHWVGDAVDSGRPPAVEGLASLPTSGSLLVDSPRGPWVVREDGSKRLLGSYGESTWSPHGLYVATTTPRQLLAVDPSGEVRWSLARRGRIAGAAWSPDGYRVAYLDGSSLRVVAGDGTGDRELERGVSRVPPAWEPGAARVLSFVTTSGSVRSVRAGSGRVLFEVRAGRAPAQLVWSPDGGRLLVRTPTRLAVFDRDGGRLWQARAPRGSEFVASAIAAHTDRVAAVLVSKRGRRSELALLGPGGRRVLFEGRGRFQSVAYSPDGRWLLLSWRSADQWLFINPLKPRPVEAISGIAAQFDPGTTSPPAFPTVAGWCCAANAH